LNEKRYIRSEQVSIEETMSGPLTIVPEGNHALREHLALFIQQQDVIHSTRILLELLEGPVELFVHVTRKVGAAEEPPITADDLSLMQMEGGMPVLMILASTKLTPDHLSTDLEAQGVFVRRLPSKELILMCRQRGIVAIELDAGLFPGVLVGPFLAGRDLMITLAPE